jgi:hypothetical protein
MTEKTMMKHLLIAAFATLSLSAAQAQDRTHEPKSPQERAKAQTERMTADLGLNAEQAAKVNAINLKYAEQMMAEREAHKAEREAKMKEARARHESMRDAQRAEMRSILTEKQYSTWVAKQDAMMEQRKEKHMEHRKEMRGDQKK